jgi:hypothetical protein
MFERALDIKDCFVETLKELKILTKYESGLDLNSDDDWNLMDDICVLLNTLADNTKTMSGSKYATLSLILPTSYALIDEFLTWNSIKTPAGRKFKGHLHTNLKARLLEYEKSKECRIATLLDPRTKKSGFRNIEDPDDPENFISDLADATVKELEAELRTLPHINSDSPVESPCKKAKTDNTLSKAAAFVAKQSRKRQTKGCDTLASFLSTDIEDMETTDVYTWWHARRDSPLHRLAMKYLTIPATSCPSERLFSLAGYLLNQRRSRLTGEHSNMILFLNENLQKKDW